MTPAPRRSLRDIDGNPVKVGQDCRAARMQDLVGQMPRLCALIEVLLQAQEDDAAIEIIKELDQTYREFMHQAKLFRDVRATLRADEQVERVTKEAAE